MNDPPEDRPLLRMIGELEAKPGKEWTSEEHTMCRSWLVSEKWDDLRREVGKAIRESPADHRAGVMAAFLDGELDSILTLYEPGYSGLWPYIAVCLRRYCWRAATAINFEQGRTRAIASDEQGPDEADVATGDPPALLLGEDLQALLQREFAGLKPEYREPLLLRIRKASHEEIAEQLGISVPLVKVRIFRARQALRKALKAAWPGLN